jgi:serine/threonine protein kinase
VKRLCAEWLFAEIEKINIKSFNLNWKMSKLVENYLLQEPVGKGVYGQVFRAVHQKTKGEYAVKVIPKSSFRSNPKLEQLAIN